MDLGNGGGPALPLCYSVKDLIGDAHGIYRGQPTDFLSFRG